MKGKRIIFYSGLLQLLLLTPGFAKTVVSVELEGFIQIPGVGFQTFYECANNDHRDRHTQYLSGSAYYRFYWEDIQASEGDFRFPLIKEALECTSAKNQTLEFRIMLMDEFGNRVPQWLLDKRAKNVPGTNFIDLEDPVVRKAHEKLIRELGIQFDDHPNVGSVDICSIGFWGEWHTSTSQNAMPSPEEQKRIVTVHGFM